MPVLGTWTQRHQSVSSQKNLIFSLYLLCWLIRKLHIHILFNWLVSVRCKFLLKGNSKQTLIIYHINHDSLFWMDYTKELILENLSWRILWFGWEMKSLILLYFDCFCCFSEESPSFSDFRVTLVFLSFLIMRCFYSYWFWETHPISAGFEIRKESWIGCFPRSEHVY